MPVTLSQVQAQWTNRDAMGAAMADIGKALLSFEQVLMEAVNANVLSVNEATAILQAYQSKLLGSAPAHYSPQVVRAYQDFVRACEGDALQVSRQTINGDEVITVSQSQ